MIRLAWNLIRIPRLFASLLVLPLFGALCIVVIQTLVTKLAVQGVTKGQSFQTQNIDAPQRSIVRQLIYGNAKKRPPLRVCRWIQKPLRSGDFLEIPPGKECVAEPLDVAVLVTDPQTFDPSHYAELFNGTFDRLHLCMQNCETEIQIQPKPNSPPRIDLFSLSAMLLLNDARDSTLQARSVQVAVEDLQRSRALFGEPFLHSPGLRAPIDIHELSTSTILILNISLLVVSAVWLALRAHRRVLEYFSQSGSLLPLVAASGSRSVYGALWLITSFRVLIFLVAGLPALTIILHPDGGQPLLSTLFHDDLLAAFLWIAALSSSVVFATLIASLSDLYARHSLIAALYRIVPVGLSIVGIVMWLLTFTRLSAYGAVVRLVLTSLPVVGLGPVIVAPMVKPAFEVLALHSILACVGIAILARINARWFSAHTEEL